MGGGNVIVINNKEEWETYMNKSKNEGLKVAVDFTASWCGPCRAIGPYFAQLSQEISGVTFLSVDVDACSDVAQLCNISAMPTFHFFSNGVKVEEVIGASKDKLKASIQKLLE